MYLAPMEGLTGYVYRDVFRELFGGADKYFTPFIGPAEKKVIRTRDRREIDPENNKETNTVPQIMTNRSEDFLYICRLLVKLGYREVNLNAGCPAGTVVSRHRGAGILGWPKELDQLLYGIFEGLETDPEISDSGLRVSVKTRLGLRSSEEFPALLEIYNRYPLSELIIHARTRSDFYEGKPDHEMFVEALKNSACPVCYNGDVNSLEDYREIVGLYGDRAESAVMIGRGVIAEPGLIREIRTGRKTEKHEWKKYVDTLFQRYREELDGDRHALMRMKEVWTYLGKQFPGRIRELKDLKKAANTAEYESAVMRIFLG